MSQYVTIADVTIDTPVKSPNTDGIDPDSSAHVVIKGCSIATGDDHISLKAGKEWEGYEYAVPTHDVVIVDNTFHHGAGIAIGSETAGGIRDVFIGNGTFMDLSSNMVRFKTCPTYGRGLSNVTYASIRGIGLDAAVMVNMDYECGPPNATIPRPTFDRVTIQDIHLDAVLSAGSIACLPGACPNWVFRDVTIGSLVDWKITSGGLVNTSAINVHPALP